MALTIYSHAIVGPDTHSLPDLGVPFVAKLTSVTRAGRSQEIGDHYTHPSHTRFALPGSLGNLVAESGHLYFPWFRGSGNKGEPYDKAKTAKLSRAGQTGASFTISIQEVEDLTLVAMAARAVCLAAAGH